MQANHETPSPLSARLFWPGLIFLLLAVAASVVLVGKHLDVLVAPGCGAGSPCEQAAASVWGKVPIVGWPVSFVGLAYFAALTTAWITIRRAGVVPGMFRNLVRLGVVFSAMFMVVMLFGGYACPYCIAVHLANFGFLGMLELAPITMKGTRPALGWVAAGFIVVTGVELSLQAAVKEEVEQQYAESTQQIIEASTDPDREPFTGRYLLGPANAPIRLVLISDFQCSDCKIFEQQVRNILARHDNVSVSMKHFPFCTACNQYATKNLHPNACWAARAAEAAGILRGNDGFWQMHRWLFDRSASFTDGEIRAALAQFGYDVREFLDVMQGEETLRRVQADIEEATRLGLFRTPMIFINGVELKGWMAQPNALVRAVDELAARKPPPGSATQDHPPPAFEKYVADWRDQPQRSLPDDARAWNMGPDGAVVDIVAWGDYQEPFSAEADGRLRRITASRGDTRYTFRHYPIDQACNPVAPRTLHPLACLASRAAEAAGTIAGSDGYWAMHAWLFDDLDRLSEQTLAEAAAELGIDQGLLFTEMRSRAVTDAIAADARAGKVMGLDSVPFIFINGKRVPHWRKKGLLDAMVDEAARGQSSTSR
ncbi:MAG: DsbA family protein [Planctomycetota bacterium]|jgi:protein-disulfide isomerase